MPERTVVLTSAAFTLEEVGWLCNEARLLGLRRPQPGGMIEDAHRRDPGFALLASHPRLLRPARSILRGAPAILGTRLWPGGETGPEGLSVGFGPPALAAIVFLDDAPADGRPPEILPGGPAIAPRSGRLLLAGGVRLLFTGWAAPFFAVALDTRGAPPAVGADDACLWPSPYWSAG